MKEKNQNKLTDLKKDIENLFEQYVFLMNERKIHSKDDFDKAYQKMPKSVNKIFKEISEEEALDIFIAIFVRKKGSIINDASEITVVTADEANDFSEEMISFLKMCPLKYKVNISVGLLFEGACQINIDDIICNFSGKFLQKNTEGYYIPLGDQGLCFFEKGLCINSHSLVFKKVLSFLKFFVQQGLYAKLYIKKKDEMKQSLSADLSGLARLAAISQKPKKEVVIDSVYMTCLDDGVKYFDKEKIELPSNVCYFLSKLQSEDGNESLTEEYIRKWLLKLRDVIKKSHDSNSPERSVVSASNWCFDSYVAEEDNITQAFLHICFGLEALFGKKEDWRKPGVGIADGIRIKCSYLISENVSEREIIMKDIKDMYELRSDLVHGRKLFLEEKELTLFNKARSFLERSIDAEIKLLNFN